MRRRSAEALGKIGSDKAVETLFHLLTLIPRAADQVLSVIIAIQARCKYYNYDIAQTPLPPEDNPNPTNIFNINAPLGQLLAGNQIVQGDNIATQNNQNTAPEF